MQRQNSNQQSPYQSPQELNKKNKADLQAIFTDTTGNAPDDSLTKQQLIDAIVEAHPAAEATQAKEEKDQENDLQDNEVPVSNSRSQYGNYAVDSDLFFGNKDRDKKHKLPKDWAKQVCVWQCNI